MIIASVLSTIGWIVIGVVLGIIAMKVVIAMTFWSMWR